MIDKDKAFDRWQSFRMEAYEKGEDMSKADAKFEKWLIRQQIKENMNENPSLYRGKNEGK